MTWFDYTILGIIAVSVLFSIIHGFVRELLSLASWIIAFVIAQFYADSLAPMLPAAIPNPALRLLVAFLVIFLLILVLMTLITMIISGLVRRSGLGAPDRMLGAVFGFARGIAISLMIVLLAGLTALPKQPVWRDAMLSPPFEAMASTVKVWLPHDLAKYIKYK